MSRIPLIGSGTTWLSSASWSPFRMRSLDPSKLHWVHYPVCFSSIPPTPTSASHALSPHAYVFDHPFDYPCHLRISKTISLFRQSLHPHKSSSSRPSCLTILQSTKRRFRPHSGDLVLVFPTSSVWSPNLSSFSFLFSYSSPILC